MLDSPIETAKGDATKAPGDPAPDLTAQCISHARTDLGNTERLITRHGHDLRFSAALGWLLWTGARFRRDEPNDIVTRMKHTVRSILNEVVALLEEARDERDHDKRKSLRAQADALYSHGRKSESQRALFAAIKLAETEPGVYVDPAHLDANPWLFNCKNGTIDLRTGKLQPHDRKDLITKRAPVAFDPDAGAPRWTAFLEQILPDAEVRAFFQRAVGYALTGEVSEQCLFFLYGSGSNGKSTALLALMDIMGDYALQAAPDLLISKEKNSGPNNEVADLQGARLVATIEVEDGQRMAESLVKQITGGDKIKARFMRQDYFAFEPTHKIFLAANHQPTIRGQDHAMWRRIKVLPFVVKIGDADKDTTLREKLRAEQSGILAWAVRGCLEWQANGLQEPEAVQEATQNYRGDMDVLRDFLDDCCVLLPSLTIASGVLYRAYERWCGENGTHALGSKNFTSRLKEQEIVLQGKLKCGDTWVRGWTGIALRSDRSDHES